MRITILALGTRGDVQPYIALGLGLQATGHQVTIASLDIFEDFVNSKGLDFASLGSVPEKLKQRSQNTNKGNNITFNGIWGRMNWWSIFGSSLENLINNTWEVCQKTEVNLIEWSKKGS
ncbi:glycosyltransferase [Crocosphaera sp. XPORK-15E]|uniref:glycosyltransferase n=1 Tax=Crocosphaera sp. XPORK-15E TaxID=3110247 RepID=UPI002B21FE37|nr:glycosyltransferase [Crocosphaera sp. XPORK-15E]MEA5534921.1 glycosyltransferase [Crocosphaera sp. XPORK-15E]